MLNNESEYGADVLEYNPDRFLRPKPSGQAGVELNPNVRHPATIAFGFGRRCVDFLLSLICVSAWAYDKPIRYCRICPGSHIAQSTLWLTAACLLTLFDFETPAEKANYINRSGKVDERFDPGFLCHPKEYECVFKLRSEEARVLMGELSMGV